MAKRRNPERICALYSNGPHYVRMLRRIRAVYPSETVIAAIPADFPPGAIADIADEFLRLPPATGLGAMRRAFVTARRLRRARCGHIVVMFDSPRLNLLARLSGAGRAWCFTVDGRFYGLSRSLAHVLLTPIGQRIRGEWDYLRARLGTARRGKPEA